MEIEAPINRLPQGLLSFLDIKSMGRNPNKLEASVRATIDLTDWYQTNAQVHFINTAAPTFAVSTTQSFVPFTTAAPAGLPLTCPSQEVWLVSEFTTQWTFSVAAGGETDGVGPAVQGTVPALATRSLPRVGSGWLTSSAAISRGGFAQLARPLFVLPGETLGFVHGGTVLGAGTFFVFGAIKLLRLQL